MHLTYRTARRIAAAEAAYSAVMWWPCLRMRNTGCYMGVPANDAVAEMRVIDLYRRDGEKLAENWIFIDMLHFLAQQGVDLLLATGPDADAVRQLDREPDPVHRR